MNHTTMKRDGGWTVELITPIDGVTELNIHPTSLDHNIRWGDGLIPSVLALLSELTGVKETSLRRLTGTDSDRVLIAFTYVVPNNIRDDFAKNTRPLATPFEEMTPELQYDVTAGDNDPEDPRFPRMPGKFVRYGEKERPPEPPPPPQPPPPEAETKPPEDSGGMNIAPPEVMRKVG